MCIYMDIRGRRNARAQIYLSSQFSDCQKMTIEQAELPH